VDKASWNIVEKTVQIQNWKEETKRGFLVIAKRQAEEFKESTEGDYLRGLFQSAMNQYEEGHYQTAGELFIFLKDLLILGLKPDRNDPINMSEVYFAIATSLQAFKRFKFAHPSYILSYLYDQTNPTPIFWASECLIEMGEIGKARGNLELVTFIGKGNPEYAELVEKANDRLVQLSTGGVDVE